MSAATAAIRSALPARLDRLSWSKFHTRMVLGLGAVWILAVIAVVMGAWSFAVSRRRAAPAVDLVPG